MSVISIPRLPDQVTVNFGPAESAGRAILQADRKVRDVGIRLSLSSDFDELLRINQSNGRDWYALPPMFDSRYNAINAENGFWLRGVDQHGDVVLSHAVRLYVWRRTDLKEEVETLRFLYSEPARRADAVARGEVTAPSATQIKGRVSYSGALWVRSDFRGHGLARLIPPLSRALALTRWYPEFHVCFVSTATARKGMGRTYGYRREEEAVRFVNLPNFETPLEFALCWMSTEDAVEEVEGTTSGAGPAVGIRLERQTGDHAPASA